MQIRRFSPDRKSKVSGGHPGLYAVPVQMDAGNFSADPQEREAVFQRMSGAPILLKREMAVLAMYIEAHGSMDEHSGEMPILFLVTGGSGFVRVGGPNGETRKVTAGDAVLWPAGVDHTVWTEDEPLQAIIIDGPTENE